MTPLSQPRHIFACTWLVAQSLGIASWWGVLLLHPPARAWFVIPGSPDLTLLAFLLPDAVFGIGAGLIAAHGLWRTLPAGRTALVLVTGAMGYAALYCLMVALAGGGWLGAVMMLPSLVAMPLLCRWTRP